MIVVDTHLVSFLLVDGDRTADARRCYKRDDIWRMPPLWRSEMLNVLTSGVSAGTLSEATAFKAWQNARNLFGSNEHEPSGEAVLEASLRDGLTAYEAQYVVTAEDLSAMLVTGNPRIAAARPDLAITIGTFASGG
jgi:predicted nucleic acid-binding protein